MPPVIPRDLRPAPKAKSYEARIHPDSLTQVADARNIKDYVNAVLSWSPRGPLAIHSNTPQGQANGSETPTAKPSLPSAQKNRLPSTRVEHRAAFYDKHFNPKLLALSIVHCPDLLARIVDTGAAFWKLYIKDIKAKTVGIVPVCMLGLPLKLGLVP